MHMITLVLVPRDAPDLFQAVLGLLGPHRRGGDHPGRFDYWSPGAESIADPQSAALLGVSGDEDLAGNVCLVSRLPPDFVPGAVVSQDGWHDLFDHGFRLLDEDGTPGNRAALAAWTAQARQLLAAHAACVAVELDTHS